MVLYTFDEHGKIFSEYEVSGGQCAGPAELKDRIELCPKRTCTMINATTFVIKSVQEFYTNWEDLELNKSIQVDSTQWRIEIDQSGKIVEIK